MVIKMENKQSVSWDVMDDMAFYADTTEAWKAYDRGEFVRVSKEEFLKELDEW